MVLYKAVLQQVIAIHCHLTESEHKKHNKKLFTAACTGATSYWFYLGSFGQ